MISRLVFLLFCGHFAQILGNAGKLPRVKRQSLKVQINATSDAVCMRYIRPSPSTKLEGFILGYGSSFFSNQYIPLPSNGKTYITEVDAEPRYLIAVRPAPVPNYKKPCSGRKKTPKPLQLVIGNLTPTSVFLSWGILVNPKHDWTTMNNCPNDRFYTVRYREKDKDKKWILQLCPTTETVVDNLKPNTNYEFGVKDNTDNGIWSKIFTHKVVMGGKNKENGQLQNNYKLPKIQTQFIPDSKTLVPVQVIKQVLQNITHRTQSEIKSPLSGPILVHLIVPGLNATRQKPPSSSRLDIFEKPKKILAKNKTQEQLANESKTSEVKEITPRSQTATAEQDWESSKPTAPSVSEESSINQASSKMQPVPSEPPTPVPQTIQAKPVSSKRQPVFSSPQTSDEIAIPDSIPAVTNEPTLESPPSKTSKTLDRPRTTLAPTETPFTTLKWKPSATPEGWHEKPVSSLPSVKQNIPKTSRITEKLKAPPAEKESQQKTTTSSIFKTSELPRTTMAPRKKKIPVSKPQLLPHLEEPKIALAVTSKLVPLPATTKISATDGHPVATMVSTGADSFPSKLSTPKLPFTEPASYEPSPLPSISKELDYTRPEERERKLVSTEADNYLPKLLTTPELPSTKPVSTEADNYLPKLLTTPELPSTKPDAKAKHQVSTPKTTANPQMLHPKPEKDYAGHKPQTSTEVPQPQHDVIFKTEQAKSSTAPKETHRVPTRSKTSSSPGIIPTKSSLKVKHPVPSKPKTPPSQKIPQSKPEIIPFSQDPITTMLPVAPEKTKETFDPKETRLPSSKPKPSDKQEISQTKPVVLRTTPAPARTRTPGRLFWSKMPTGDKLTDEDVAKPLSTSSSTKSNIPLDSSVTRKKPDPVATARTTPIRRRPLPPNTVTGKPGRSGNVLIPRASSFLTSSVAKPTWPSSLVKTNSAKKLPTAAASPDYSNPMFSSLPTTETDIAGTPRYTGDHVKYIQKEEDVPCSITDTLQHFPTEMEDDTDMATSAPQKPPTNLTVVTVEGCPSFIILDWQKPENETVTEYKVVSTENGGPAGKDKSIITTNQTHSTVENLKPNTSYEFVVIASNPLGEGPSSESKPFRTESADPRVTESISMGKDAIWTEVNFNSDDYSECKGKQYVKRTWYKKFVGVQLCNSLRYKIYLSNSLTGTFYNIGDQRGHGEDHCQFVDSYLDGRTGQMLPSDQLPTKDGYFRAVRQEPVHFGKIGAATHTTYVHWYECGTTIPGKW